MVIHCSILPDHKVLLVLVVLLLPSFSSQFLQPFKHPQLFERVFVVYIFLSCFFLTILSGDEKKKKISLINVDNVLFLKGFGFFFFILMRLSIKC